MPTLGNAKLQALLDKQEPLIRAAFLDAIRTHATGINVEALIQALERGDFNRAVQIASITPAMLYPLDAAISGAYVSGGQMVVNAAPAYAVSFGFDGRSPRAEAWARANVARFVTEIVADQEAAIRQVIADNITRGPRSVALDVVGRLNRATGRREGGIVGLHSGQARTVFNVRSDLENLNNNYFSRKLRDKRFDSLVMRAIRDGKPLSATDIDRITRAYSERALRHRGEVIARTESINALRAGRHEGIRQAVEQGAIREDRTKKVWDATMDARTRRDHRAMDGESVRIDEPFSFPNGGEAMYPGDGDLGAPEDQIIQCRCTVRYDVDWLRA